VLVVDAETTLAVVSATDVSSDWQAAARTVTSTTGIAERNHFRLLETGGAPARCLLEYRADFLSRPIVSPIPSPLRR